MSLGEQLSLSTLPHVLLTVSDESWRSAQFIYATALMSLGDQVSLSTLPHVLLTVSYDSWRPAQFIYATACTADTATLFLVNCFASGDFGIFFYFSYFRMVKYSVSASLENVVHPVT
ncbi:hypothetical protein J6590_012168 [Homalodisca vitripennis]|nr:hypothetical protein J6590_012168 [Homalodisca vitripennis]